MAPTGASAKRASQRLLGPGAPSAPDLDRAESGISRAVSEPPETPKRLAREAERGEDEATPLILISGMTLLLAAFVAVIVAIGLALYFLV